MSRAGAPTASATATNGVDARLCCESRRSGFSRSHLGFALYPGDAEPRGDCERGHSPLLCSSSEGGVLRAADGPGAFGASEGCQFSCLLRPSTMTLQLQKLLAALCSVSDFVLTAAHILCTSLFLEASLVLQPLGPAPRLSPGQYY